MGLRITDLPVANYMTPYPISVNPDVIFSEAVNFMAERGVGNLIVNNGTVPQGILTERDIIHAIALSKDISKLKVRDMSSQPYVKLTLGHTVLDAATTMISRKSRLLVFADDDKLVGIITASDLLRAFRKTSNAPLLDEVASSKVIKCKHTDTILDAVKILHDKRIGSVIVEKTGNYGIFTERDLLVHVLANEVDLTGEVGGYSSFPLVVAKQDIKGNEAASIMAANNIKRLGLSKNDALVGIITARDVVDAYQSTLQALNLKDEFKENESVTR